MIVAPFEHPPCPACQGSTERFYPIGGGANGVIPDDILGGTFVENLGHQPVWVESKSQLRREMAARGLVSYVRHVSGQESDKSPITTRWY